LKSPFCQPVRFVAKPLSICLVIGAVDGAAQVGVARSRMYFTRTSDATVATPARGTPPVAIARVVRWVESVAAAAERIPAAPFQYPPAALKIHLQLIAMSPRRVVNEKIIVSAHPSVPASCRWSRPKFRAPVTSTLLCRRGPARRASSGCRWSGSGPRIVRTRIEDALLAPKVRGAVLNTAAFVGNSAVDIERRRGADVSVVLATDPDSRL